MTFKPGAEDMIAKQMARSGHGQMKEAPILTLGLGLYYTAFFELNTCRHSGWTMLPIPFSAIRDYCESYELDAHQTESMFHHIKAMDATFLKHVNQSNVEQPQSQRSFTKPK